MKSIAKAVLAVEPLLLVIIAAASWFPESYQVNTLLLLIPPACARLVLYRRLWVSSPLNLYLFAFLILSAANTAVALASSAAPPYSWGWYQVGKLAMGMALALGIVTIIYERGRIGGLLLGLLGLAVLVGVLGLGSAQFIAGKSAQMTPIIERLPQLRGFPGAEGGFNVNEIGGAMAYFAPLAAGIAIYDWRVRKAPWRMLTATLAFVLLLLALFLGQSRLSVLGVIIALGGLILLLIPARRWQYLALALLLALCGLEGLIVTQVALPTTVATRYAQTTEASTTMRLEIWRAALTLIRENPLTGYGLNQFRRREVRNMYVPKYNLVFIPHAHNELLQIGTDTGIPGMLLYLAWNLTLVWMIWRTWRKGDPFLKAVGLSAGAGLAAHAFFGLGDAITLFDRFAFVYWLFVGLVGSAYVLACRSPAAAHPEMECERESFAQSEAE